jgi:putative transposase
MKTKSFIWINVEWFVGDKSAQFDQNSMVQVVAHLRENAKNKNIVINAIQGKANRIWCTLRIKATMSVSKAVNLLKGESSWWANRAGLFQGKFKWDAGYRAFSVTKEIVERVVEMFSQNSWNDLASHKFTGWKPGAKQRESIEKIRFRSSA